MTTPWLEAFPRTVGPVLEEIDSVVGFSLTRLIADGPNSRLSATENAQPAIMATSVVILRVLEHDFGFRPAERVHYTLGHSLGEFAALVAGGYLSFPDALTLVRRRAEVMAACTRQATQAGGGAEYGMVALVCETDRLASLVEAIREFLGHSSAGSKQDSAEEVPPIQQVLIANINAKNQIVLSGSIERIKTLLAHVRQFGGHDPRAVHLNTDSPFHSPIMLPALEAMRALLDRPRRSSSSLESGESSRATSPTTTRGSPSASSANDDEDIVSFPGHMPCISNVTARPFPSRRRLKDLLARQCVETVLWADSIRYLDQEERVRRWLGIGPGLVGRNLVGKEVGMRQGAVGSAAAGASHVKGGGVWGVCDPRDVEGIMKELDETERISID